MRNERGFTLPEVLIALLILALIASASVYALRLGVDSRDQLDAADAALKELQIARILMKEDFAQVVARPVRDELGQLEPAAFYGGEVPFLRRLPDDETLLVSFVRDGWLNADARTPRSALQHVEYVFKNGALIRRARVYLDNAGSSDALERALFSDLKSAEMEFLIGEADDKLQWSNVWPLGGAGGPGGPPPRAVALTLTKEDGEELRQLFWIGEIGATGS